MEFSVKEGAKRAIRFGVCGGSVAEVQRRFRNEFKRRIRKEGEKREKRNAFVQRRPGICGGGEDERVVAGEMFPYPQRDAGAAVPSKKNHLQLVERGPSPTPTSPAAATTSAASGDYNSSRCRSPAPTAPNVAPVPAPNVKENGIANVVVPRFGGGDRGGFGLGRNDDLAGKSVGGGPSPVAGLTVEPQLPTHPHPVIPSAAGAKQAATWSSITSGGKQDLPRARFFQHEFPSLAAGATGGTAPPSADKDKDAPAATTEGGLSLRPQTEGSWTQGGGVKKSPSEENSSNAPTPAGDGDTPAPPVAPPPHVPPPSFLYSHPPPPLSTRGPPNPAFPRYRAEKPSTFTGSNGAHPPRADSKTLTNSIIKKEEMSQMDRLMDDLGEDSWVGSKDIDFTKTLDFSDDEDGQGQQGKPNSKESSKHPTHNDAKPMPQLPPSEQPHAVDVDHAHCGPPRSSSRGDGPQASANQNRPLQQPHAPLGWNSAPYEFMMQQRPPLFSYGAPPPMGPPPISRRYEDENELVARRAQEVAAAAERGRRRKEEDEMKETSSAPAGASQQLPPRLRNKQAEQGNQKAPPAAQATSPNPPGQPAEGRAGYRPPPGYGRKPTMERGGGFSGGDAGVGGWGQAPPMLDSSTQGWASSWGNQGGKDWAKEDEEEKRKEEETSRRRAREEEERRKKEENNRRENERRKAPWATGEPMVPSTTVNDSGILETTVDLTSGWDDEQPTSQQQDHSKRRAADGGRGADYDPSMRRSAAGNQGTKGRRQRGERPAAPAPITRERLEKSGVGRNGGQGASNMTTLRPRSGGMRGTGRMGGGLKREDKMGPIVPPTPVDKLPSLIDDIPDSQLPPAIAQAKNAKAAAQAAAAAAAAHAAQEQEEREERKRGSMDGGSSNGPSAASNAAANDVPNVWAKKRTFSTESGRWADEVEEEEKEAERKEKEEQSRLIEQQELEEQAKRDAQAAQERSQRQRRDGRAGGDGRRGGRYAGAPGGSGGSYRGGRGGRTLSGQGQSWVSSSRRGGRAGGRSGGYGGDDYRSGYGGGGGGMGASSAAGGGSRRRREEYGAPSNASSRPPKPQQPRPPPKEEESKRSLLGAEPVSPASTREDESSKGGTEESNQTTPTQPPTVVSLEEEEWYEEEDEDTATLGGAGRRKAAGGSGEHAGGRGTGAVGRYVTSSTRGAASKYGRGSGISAPARRGDRRRGAEGGRSGRDRDWRSGGGDRRDGRREKKEGEGGEEEEDKRSRTYRDDGYYGRGYGMGTRGGGSKWGGGGRGGRQYASRGGGRERRERPVRSEEEEKGKREKKDGGGEGGSVVPSSSPPPVDQKKGSGANTSTAGAQAAPAPSSSNTASQQQQKKRSPTPPEKKNENPLQSYDLNNIASVVIVDNQFGSHVVTESDLEDSDFQEVQSKRSKAKQNQEKAQPPAPSSGVETERGGREGKGGQSKRDKRGAEGQKKYSANRGIAGRGTSAGARVARGVPSHKSEEQVSSSAQSSPPPHPVSKPLPPKGNAWDTPITQVLSKSSVTNQTDNAPHASGPAPPSKPMGATPAATRTEAVTVEVSSALVLDEEMSSGHIGTIIFENTKIRAASKLTTTSVVSTASSTAPPTSDAGGTLVGRPPSPPPVSSPATVPPQNQSLSPTAQPFFRSSPPADETKEARDMRGSDSATTPAQQPAKKHSAHHPLDLTSPISPSSIDLKERIASVQKIWAMQDPTPMHQEPSVDLSQTGGSMSTADRPSGHHHLRPSSTGNVSSPARGPTPDSASVHSEGGAPGRGDDGRTHPGVQFEGANSVNMPPATSGGPPMSNICKVKPQPVLNAGGANPQSGVSQMGGVGGPPLATPFFAPQTHILSMSSHPFTPASLAQTFSMMATAPVVSSNNNPQQSNTYGPPMGIPPPTIPSPPVFNTPIYTPPPDPNTLFGVSSTASLRSQSPATPSFLSSPPTEMIKMYQPQTGPGSGGPPPVSMGNTLVGGGGSGGPPSKRNGGGISMPSLSHMATGTPYDPLGPTAPGGYPPHQQNYFTAPPPPHPPNPPAPGTHSSFFPTGPSFTSYAHFGAPPPPLHHPPPPASGNAGAQAYRSLYKESDLMSEAFYGSAPPFPPSYGRDKFMGGPSGGLGSLNSGSSGLGPSSTFAPFAASSSSRGSGGGFGGFGGGSIGSNPPFRSGGGGGFAPMVPGIRGGIAFMSNPNTTREYSPQPIQRPSSMDGKYGGGSGMMSASDDSTGKEEEQRRKEDGGDAEKKKESDVDKE
ncbi:unnamed protein product [Cyprideis torosa]|uniref:Uncharacterized protein n=1 Tax=Cyprideis torosa TaxID=163714 RepID=A0A7R8WCJ5_9CRUS|nr:unnamed protein product [Cyprideis torosa]CAG0893534.1 unnamed protein product [Cyprideis torosa]